MATRSRSSNPDPKRVAEWLAASCARSGVAVKVSDPNALRQIGVLLRAEARDAPPQAKREARPRPRALQPPNGVDPLGVQGPVARDGGGSDDDVVDQGPDDGGL